MKRLAEGCDGVHRLLVVEAKNGVDASRELGTNQKKEKEEHFEKTLNRDRQTMRIKLNGGRQDLSVFL